MNPLMFADPAFLFCFAPVVLSLYYLFPRGWCNPFLLTATLFLYAWGEGRNVGVLVASIVINYAFGLWIARAERHRKAFLAAGVAANVGLLTLFKYSAFVVSNADVILHRLGSRGFPVPRVTLPVGLSFFTFMAISYLVDIYRRETEPEKNPGTFGLYLALFPHLIAGPIVRFRDIAVQLHDRRVSGEDRLEGIRRFVIGLGKKVLIGNTVATTVDAVFALSPERLSADLAWTGLLCYTIQIYFDFAGYSDMAIGLARMLGFRFPENFDYPYVSQSISEFWRRWHISLSTWLRDYLFFPLGVRGSRWKLYRNTILVFLICGLWHGPAWHYVLWGGFHGILLVFERLGLRRTIGALPRVLRHAYALVAVMIGWVFFRAETIPQAATYLSAMFGLGRAPLASFEIPQYLPVDVMLALAVGTAASVPIRMRTPEINGMASIAKFAALAAVLLAALAFASAQTYRPFIYFRF